MKETFEELLNKAGALGITEINLKIPRHRLQVLSEDIRGYHYGAKSSKPNDTITGLTYIYAGIMVNLKSI
jgi:hypothetical protein